MRPVTGRASVVKSRRGESSSSQGVVSRRPQLSATRAGCLAPRQSVQAAGAPSHLLEPTSRLRRLRCAPVSDDDRISHLLEPTSRPRRSCPNPTPGAHDALSSADRQVAGVARSGGEGSKRASTLPIDLPTCAANSVWPLAWSKRVSTLPVVRSGGARESPRCLSIDLPLVESFGRKKRYPSLADRGNCPPE